MTESKALELRQKFLDKLSEIVDTAESAGFQRLDEHTVGLLAMDTGGLDSLANQLYREVFFAK